VGRAQEGTASGHTNSDATVTVTQRMNGKVGDDTFQFADVHATLTGNENLSFSGPWNADPAELHASLSKKASENSHSTNGTHTFTIDAAGLHWSGETTTETVDGGLDKSGSGGSDTIHDNIWSKLEQNSRPRRLPELVEQRHLFTARTWQYPKFRKA